MREFLLIAAGAAAGANTRYWVGSWFAARYGPAFPWGTLFINVSGGFLIGLVLSVLGQRLVADPTARLLLVTGFLGAYTTFSTFTYETVVLIQQGELWSAGINAAGSVLLGVAATFGGLLVARLLF